MKLFLATLSMLVFGGLANYLSEEEIKDFCSVYQDGCKVLEEPTIMSYTPEIYPNTTLAEGPLLIYVHTPPDSWFDFGSKIPMYNFSGSLYVLHNSDDVPIFLEYVSFETLVILQDSYDTFNYEQLRLATGNLGFVNGLNYEFVLEPDMNPGENVTRKDLQPYDEFYNEGILPDITTTERVQSTTQKPNTQTGQSPEKFSSGAFTVDGVDYDKNCQPMRCSQSKHGYFPHPKYCNKYYQCDGAIVYTHTCGLGTEFSPVSNICNYPEQSQNHVCDSLRNCND